MMTKEQFLKQLAKGLKRLPAEERQDILRDYQEHFMIGIEEGETEEGISASLGSPRQIAKELLATYHLEQVETTTTTGNILRAMYAVLGLGFLNLVFVLGPFIALIGVLVAGWVAGTAFIISPLLVITDAVVHPGTFQAFFLFFSIMLCGLGFFINIGMFFATKAAADGFIRYLKFNMKIVKGGHKNDDQYISCGFNDKGIST
ncbi:MAG TPA: DUF1700 domain-containing protein [Halanaerobiales bacterium]|nr:DUF1700 domain-containing protein [Halanaerobiales bacterium]